MIDITFRLPRQEDVSFITHSWLRSTKLAVDKDIAYEAYYGDYKKLISKRLASSAKILVACSIEDPDFIIGFAVYDDNVVHYIYVRYALRRQGIAKSLLSKVKADKKEYISHKPLWWSKDYRYKKIFKYNPYAFFLERNEIEN
jgi:GNAT superfamily N-acetyltransferase